MVAEKLDPTVVQTCFRRIFQTVRNLKKMTMGMSSEGPKMGEGGMGRPRVAGKQQNPVTHRGDRRRVRQPDPGASDGDWP